MFSSVTVTINGQPVVNPTAGRPRKQPLKFQQDVSTLRVIVPKLKLKSAPLPTVCIPLPSIAEDELFSDDELDDENESDSNLDDDDQRFFLLFDTAYCD